MPDDVAHLPDLSPPFGGVAWDDDASAGDWIRPRLGEWGTVGSCVPSGYAAYARIPDMPAWAEEEEGIGSLYLGRSDESGPEQMDLLIDALAPFTGDQLCHFALWTGYGWLYDHAARPEDSTSFALLSFGIDDVGEGDAPGSSFALAQAQAEARVRALRAAHQVERPAAPMLELPHRAYHLWHGPLAQAAAFASLHQSPTLWWPQDRSWFVCTELDTVATDLGGSEELVAALLEVPGLRASRVSPGDPVQMPADW
ncbi:hypothetical protein [Oerskovia enterophila]|uniref:Uncharacterized protein n=1 Tax=Oerskovia enterophila TaxID=43678 RepID=A0A163S8H8_9CELL|nr:hypothetical protein [Oerskovia enterophila]KZM36115.1 hypothetical protein OJAG_12100 [Oerskovia enterophila]